MALDVSILDFRRQPSNRFWRFKVMS